MTPERDPATTRLIEWRIFPAVIIIAVGVLFLLGNLGFDLGFLFHGNWWALFILLGAIAPLGRAYEIYRERGRFDAEAAYSTLAGAAVVLVACMFLLGLDWGVWWPLFVILGGLFTLVRRPRDRYRQAAPRQPDGDAAIKH